MGTTLNGTKPKNTYQALLKTTDNTAIDATLKTISDGLGTDTPLQLSTTETQINSTLRIHTDNAELLDIENASGSNRFNINRVVQNINLDFASKPTDITTQVGAIRTAIDGTNLADVVKFQENGQVTITERLKLESDSTVTTQTSSVIQSSTTNANLVIAPNGTGALVASIPDGTATGGNARGTGSVDLQMSRSTQTQIASGSYSFVVGQSNTASNAYSFVGGQSNTISGQGGVGLGRSNSSTGDDAVVFGNGNSITGAASQSGILSGNANTVSSARSVVCGGQSNTASTNTHATVVGGQSNTASGLRATVLGGNSNTSSGDHSIAGGNGSTASGTWAVALGYQNGATNTATFATGREALANSAGAIAMGNSNPVALATNAVAIGTASRATSINSVALGANSVSVLYNQFSTLGGGIGQASNLKAYSTTDLLSGGGIVLTLDGTGVTNVIASGLNAAWNVQVNWVAVVTAITGTATGISVGDVITSIDLLVYKRVAGVITVSPHTSVATKTLVTTPAAYAACAINYGTSGAADLRLTFTAPTFAGGGSVTMRVVARVELSEVAW